MELPKDYILHLEAEGNQIKTISVELTHCKDCAGYDPDDEDIREGRCYWWPEMPTVPAYGFCHQGEPKTAEER
jgi:hypothetical protein